MLCINSLEKGSFKITFIEKKRTQFSELPKQRFQILQNQSEKQILQKQKENNRKQQQAVVAWVSNLNGLQRKENW